MSISSKRFSIGHLAAIGLIVSLLTSSATLFFNAKKSAEGEPENYSCNYKLKRVERYQYVKPLLFVDEDCESHGLSSIKYKVNAIIDKAKADRKLTTASVYLRSQDGWLEINGGEKYEPGSLFKVPILMSILKIEEEHPGFLNKQILYSQPFETGKRVSIASKTIQLGKTYTIRELLEYMIKYSDNQATCLLQVNFDMAVLQRLFTDIGLDAPNMYADKFFFTVKDYSLFMRTIYNAGYLNIKNSEYAAELLSQCDFNEGIVAGLPAGMKVAHKFGETGDDFVKQLHESAIVYIENRPYLLTVMTRGGDFASLKQFMAETSKAVFEEMKAKADL